MKKLFEVVVERAVKESELAKLQNDFKRSESELSSEISNLKRLENISAEGLDVEKIQLAESIISVGGNPYGRTDQMGGKCIAEEAIIDIANNAPKMRREYFGNKTYSGYYQRCDCSYGMGPTHGSVTDRIEFKRDFDRKERELTDDEKDSCIYYLQNFITIKAAKTLIPNP